MLRGNFLRQGATPSVSVNGVRARIVERLDTTMTIEIPKPIMDSAVDNEVLVSTAVDGLEQISRSPWLWGLLGCHERRKTVETKPIGLSILEPPVRYEVTGSVKVEYTDFRDIAQPKQSFANTGSDQCDDNYRVDRRWCLTGPGTLARADVVVTSANCHSGFEGTTPSGDRCALARGAVGGCGANRGPFNTWLGCKGRGWLKYDITLVRHEPFQRETASVDIRKLGAPGESSFNFAMPPIVGLNSPQARYDVAVRVLQGQRVLHVFAISHANPNAGAITSRVNGGLLAVEISDSN